MDEHVSYAEILRQHRELLAEAAQLERMATGAREEADRDLLRGALNSLRRGLVRHFELEESDGYLKPVTDKRPTLSVRVAELRQQHDTILRGVERLDESMRSGANLDDVRGALFRVLQSLRQHESEEGELLQKTLVSDLGTGD
jgi:hemerythrin